MQTLGDQNNAWGYLVISRGSVFGLVVEFAISVCEESLHKAMLSVSSFHYCLLKHLGGAT